MKYIKANQRGVLSEELAAKVFAYRVQHGLTQRQLAQQVKVTHGTIARIEHGRVVNVALFARLRKLIEQDSK